MDKIEIKNCYFKDTKDKSSEEYSLNGKLHREDGPAYIGYIGDGKVSCEFYFLNGKSHRDNGPANIWYDKNGNIKDKIYYLNGVEIKDELQIFVMETLEMERKMRKNKIILFGLPGASKGTLCNEIIKHINITTISAGDCLREEAKKDTIKSQQIKETIGQGKLVSDELIIDILNDKINDKTQDYIFDGFPRNIAQAIKLDEVLKDNNDKIDAVIYLNISEDKLLERILGRRVCPNCNSNYHISFLPPQKDGICDKCGNDLIIRKDDNEIILKDRINTFNNETKLLLDYYQDILYEIDGALELNEKFEIFKNIYDNLEGE